MSPRAVTAAMLLVVVGAVAGCAGASDGRPVAHRSVSSPSPADGSSSPVPARMAPAGTPLGSGERVWAAFSARGQSYSAWWARLEPLLSDSARAVYVYDDPRNLPTMDLTGPIHLARKAPGEPRYTAEVVVPTSKGTFDLDLERHTLRSRWLLYAITFPPSVQ